MIERLTVCPETRYYMDKIYLMDQSVTAQNFYSIRSRASTIFVWGKVAARWQRHMRPGLTSAPRAYDLGHDHERVTKPERLTRPWWRIVKQVVRLKGIVTLRFGQHFELLVFLYKYTKWKITWNTPYHGATLATSSNDVWWSHDQVFILHLI